MPCTDRSTLSSPPAARPASSLCSARPCGDAGLDIEAIGGAEWKHDGRSSLILARTDGRRWDSFAKVCKEQQVPWMSFVSVEVELDDVAGTLGNAAEAVDDINIYGVLVLKPHGNRAVVDMGFDPARSTTPLPACRSARRHREPQAASQRTR